VGAILDIALGQRIRVFRLLGQAGDFRRCQGPIVELQVIDQAIPALRSGAAGVVLVAADDQLRRVCLENIARVLARYLGAVDVDACGGSIVRGG